MSTASTDHSLPAAELLSTCSAQVEKGTKDVIKTTMPIQSFALPLTVVLLYSGFLLQIYYGNKTAHDFAASSIYAPIIASFGYGAMIYFGQKWMETRKPFGLRSGMLMYNMFQSFLNFVVFVWFNYEVWCVKETKMTFWGNVPDYSPNGYNISFLIWVHYNNKYIELLDTFFMVARKKSEQVSFLHVYHHVLLIWAWFAVCHFAPGGDCYFGAMCNSFIHTIMYAYYAMALLGIPCPWKRHLTMCQMIQFVFCLTQSLYEYWIQSELVWIGTLQLWVMLNMLYLFGQFYKKKYVKPAASTDKVVKKEE